MKKSVTIDNKKADYQKQYCSLKVRNVHVGNRVPMVVEIATDRGFLRQAVGGEGK